MLFFYDSKEGEEEYKQLHEKSMGTFEPLSAWNKRDDYEYGPQSPEEEDAVRMDEACRHKGQVIGLRLPDDGYVQQVFNCLEQGMDTIRIRMNERKKGPEKSLCDLPIAIGVVSRLTTVFKDGVANVLDPWRVENEFRFFIAELFRIIANGCLAKYLYRFENDFLVAALGNWRGAFDPRTGCYAGIQVVSANLDGSSCSDGSWRFRNSIPVTHVEAKCIKSWMLVVDSINRAVFQCDDSCLYYEYVSSSGFGFSQKVLLRVRKDGLVEHFEPVGSGQYAFRPIRVVRMIPTEEARKFSVAMSCEDGSPTEFDANAKYYCASIVGGPIIGMRRVPTKIKSGTRWTIVKTKGENRVDEEEMEYFVLERNCTFDKPALGLLKSGSVGEGKKTIRYERKLFSDIVALPSGQYWPYDLNLKSRMKVFSQHEAREFLLREYAGNRIRVLEEVDEFDEYDDEEGNRCSDSRLLKRTRRIPPMLRFYFTSRYVDERIVQQKLWAKDAHGYVYACRRYSDYDGCYSYSGIEMVLIGNRELTSARIADEDDIKIFLSSPLRESPEDIGDDAGLWCEYLDVRYAVDLEKRVIVLGTRDDSWYEYDAETGKYEIERMEIQSPRVRHYEEEGDYEQDKAYSEWLLEIGWGRRLQLLGDTKHANYRSSQRRDAQAKCLNLLFRAEKEVVELSKENVRGLLKIDGGDLLRYFKIADEVYVSIARGPLLNIAIDPDFKIFLRKAEQAGLKMVELAHCDFVAMVDRLFSEAERACSGNE